MQGLAPTTCDKTIKNLIAEGKDLIDKQRNGRKMDMQMHEESSQILANIGNAVLTRETMQRAADERKTTLSKVTEESRMAALHGPSARMQGESQGRDEPLSGGIGQANDFLQTDDIKNDQADMLKERVEEGDADAVQELENLQAGISNRSGQCAGLGSGGKKQKKARGFSDSSPASSSGADSDKKPTGESSSHTPCLSHSKVCAFKGREPRTPMSLNSCLTVLASGVHSQGTGTVRGPPPFRPRWIKRWTRAPRAWRWL